MHTKLYIVLAQWFYHRLVNHNLLTYYVATALLTSNYHGVESSRTRSLEAVISGLMSLDHGTRKMSITLWNITYPREDTRGTNNDNLRVACN